MQICHWNIVTLIPPIMHIWYFKTSVITHVWYLKFVGHKHLPHFHRWCMFGVQNFRLWIHCCTTTNNAYLQLVEILGHRNVTKLQLIMHAWYLEFWTMHKYFTFPTMHVCFSKIWATHTSPQGLIRHSHQHLLLQQCSFALKYESTRKQGSHNTDLYI